MYYPFRDVWKRTQQKRKKKNFIEFQTQTWNCEIILILSEEISETHLKLYMKFYRMKFSLSVLYLTIHRYIVMFFAHLSSSDSLRTYRHAWCLQGRGLHRVTRQSETYHFSHARKTMIQNNGVECATKPISRWWDNNSIMHEWPCPCIMTMNHACSTFVHVWN